jgi:hypothetical protein
MTKGRRCGTKRKETCVHGICCTFSFTGHYGMPYAIVVYSDELDEWKNINMTDGPIVIYMDQGNY